MYRVPGMDFDKNYATAILGAHMELFGLQSNISLSATRLEAWTGRDAVCELNWWLLTDRVSGTTRCLERLNGRFG
ncbi:hypothetical protein B0X78_05525 [bacterium AM6]|nr:hypothetical protein B0X78_05525 [bacterium AM6]